MHVPGQGFPTAEEPVMPPNSGWGSASNESALAQGPQSNYDLSLEQGHDVMHVSGIMLRSKFLPGELTIA